jgi:hypothetical protein
LTRGALVAQRILGTYTALPGSRPTGSSRAIYADLLYNFSWRSSAVGIAAVVMGHSGVGAALVFQTHQPHQPHLG